MDTAMAAVILRRYVASTYEAALQGYEADLLGLAERGYYPVGQSWGWDAQSSSGWVVGGSSWRPGIGTLAVTFRLDRPGPRP